MGMISGYIYFAQAGEFVKIGTAKDVAKRIRELQTGCPFRVSLLQVIPGGAKTERLIHSRLSHLHVRGEWYTDTPELRQTIHLLQNEVFDLPYSRPANDSDYNNRKKVAYALSSEIHDALNHYCIQRGLNVSALVRKILGEWLTEQGYPVEWVLPWGGRRDKPATPQDDNPA